MKVFLGVALVFALLASQAAASDKCFSVFGIEPGASFEEIKAVEKYSCKKHQQNNLGFNWHNCSSGGTAFIIGEAAGIVVYIQIYLTSDSNIAYVSDWDSNNAGKDLIRRCGYASEKHPNYLWFEKGPKQLKAIYQGSILDGESKIMEHVVQVTVENISISKDIDKILSTQRHPSAAKIPNY